MKKIFTFMLIFASLVTFAQRGEIILDSQSDKATQSEPKQEIILPGNWADATQVGTYRWTDQQTNDPLGWIFGTNSYGDLATGQKFTVTDAYTISGAYFWIGAAADASGDIIFNIYDFSGATPGDVLGSVTVDLADVVAFPTGEGVTADQYEQAFYVAFDPPVTVSSDYLIGVDHSAITYEAHGDGIGMASTIVGEAGGGLGLAWILSADEGWVPATAYNEALDLDLGIFVETSGGSQDVYPVTFNVDMTDAVAAGDVTFDPAVHDVYISGSFAGWAEPGSDDQFMLTPANPAKEDVVLYPETWEGSTPVLYTTAEGYVGGTNEYGDIGKGQVYEITEEYQITGGYFWFGAAEGSGSITYTVWDFDGTPGDVLGSVTADVSDITVSDDMAGAYYIAFDEPITVNSTFMIGIDMADIGSGVVGLYSNTDPEGTDKAWEQWSDGTWYGIFDDENSFGLAIDLAIFPTVANGGNGGDEMIYTITLDVEAGDHAYKYFIVESGTTSWDNGEWTGDPNREVTINEATTINDVWGQQPGTSVEELVNENGMVVYPNPASTNIKVASDKLINEIRIFDIAGRMVYSNQIGEMNADISVDNFNRGMYFMQIFGENGVETHKIQILK